MKLLIIVSLLLAVATGATLVIVLDRLPPKVHERVDGGLADDDLEMQRLPDGTVNIHLTRRQADVCDNNGGCSVFPMQLLEKQIEQIVEDSCSQGDDPQQLPPVDPGKKL